MDVFVSADMEGITGIADPTDVAKGEAEYDAGRELMVGDVNAAIDGAVAGGADAVLVNDAHSGMTNLPRADLDDRARLIRGNTKPRSMTQGLEERHTVALFVGYHAMAGTAGGVLNHTFLGHDLLRLRVNGREVGELGWNAGMAAAHGVPVGLVTGDDATAAEAEAELGDSPETVAVKTGIDRFTADCRPPEETREAIAAAAERAVERAGAGELGVRPPETPVEMTADWATTNQAAHAAGMPGIERVGDRRTRVTAAEYPDAYEACVGMLRAGGDGRDEIYG